MRFATLAPIRLRSLFAVLALAFAGGGPARSETLAFEGRLIVTMPGFEETELASGVGVAEVDGAEIHAVDIQSASVAGSIGMPVTDPNAIPVTSVRLSASLRGGALHVDPFAPPFGEPAITAAHVELPGRFQVCMLVAPAPPCGGGFAIPLTRSGGSLGVGIGGVITFGGTGTAMVSLYGAPFTLNTAYATGTTRNGEVVTLLSVGSEAGPSLFTSSAGQPGGFLRVVTPVRIVSGYPQAPSRRIPGFLRLEIDFLPEPGVALLLGAGAAGLLALGFARRRANRNRRSREH